eukprot:IDg21260t1
MPKAKAIINLLMSKMIQLHEERGNYFFIATDSYFTLLSVLPMLRKIRIECVGTSRRKCELLPKERVFPKDAAFNNLLWCIDNAGTLAARGYDNNIALILSTVHSVQETVDRPQRRPRTTATKKHP